MRFVFGVLLGFGIGFAGAILFAPEKKNEAPWTPDSHEDASHGNGFVGTIRGRVSEAMGEARDAKKKAERDMIDRYERSVGRKSHD